MGELEQSLTTLARDAERDRVALVLREAVVAGRLTLEEFSERVGVVQSARTHGELARPISFPPLDAWFRPRR